MHELGLANWQINWANLAKYGTKTGFQLGGPIGSAKLDECTKWYHDRVYGRNGQNIYRYILRLQANTHHWNAPHVWRSTLPNRKSGFQTIASDVLAAQRLSWALPPNQ